jgi:hypothetical protein
MAARLLLVLLLAATARGCIVYEYEHEFWLKVDGSGSVNVTGRPELWTAFKAVPLDESAGEDALRQKAREVFERSGLSVRRVTVTYRGGRPYLFVAADFPDVNALAGTPAFPDLQVSLRRDGENLRMEGTWSRGPGATQAPRQDDGLMAVRFHLPSKVYSHRNAPEGVERGNIVGWSQPIARAVAREPLQLGALIDSRSILRSTVTLFGMAIAVALTVIAAVLYWVVRKGRRRRAAAA